jgi:hypothetical protein
MNLLQITFARSQRGRASAQALRWVRRLEVRVRHVMLWLVHSGTPINE